MSISNQINNEEFLFSELLKIKLENIEQLFTNQT